MSCNKCEKEIKLDQITSKHCPHCNQYNEIAIEELKKIYDIAVKYFNEKDYTNAIILLKVLTIYEVEEAMIMLAGIYCDVEEYKNYEDAYKLYKIASENNNCLA